MKEGVGMGLGVGANKTVNDHRNDGYHSYSASLNDNGLAALVHCHLSRLNNCVTVISSIINCLIFGRLTLHRGQPSTPYYQFQTSLF